MKRTIYRLLEERLGRERRFIQVMTGPRQVGKTAIALDYAKEHDAVSYFSADDFSFRSEEAIDIAWDIVRNCYRSSCIP